MEIPASTDTDDIHTGDSSARENLQKSSFANKIGKFVDMNEV
jgi:hypothetical protein